MQFKGSPDYSHGSAECLGVLLTNLGTPDAPTPAALRRYLKEFLWDPRVVEAPRWQWWLILNGIILNRRPAKSARKYAAVWTDAGSPLLHTTERQAAALEARLAARLHGPVKVVPAMRYGRPSIRDGLDALHAAGARRLLVLPLYPQYSAPTTASTFDALSEVLRGWRWLPELRMINHYHDEPAYIAALAASLREHWQTHARGERLIFSFHGLPQRYLLAGDPYHCECHKTARLVAETLGLEDGRWQVCFQSRFGREEWLKPYTDETVERLAREGVKSLDVICPGFAADCLETLEEIGEENREIFLTHGGERFHYVHALNERADHLDMLAGLVLRHAQGWPETDPTHDAAGAAQDARARALAMGAKR